MIHYSVAINTFDIILFAVHKVHRGRYTVFVVLLFKWTFKSLILGIICKKKSTCAKQLKTMSVL